MNFFSAASRQKEIYVNGSVGIKPGIPVDYQSLERLAEKKLNSEAFGYIATGAGSEKGIKNNADAFSKYAIIPKMAHGGVTPDLSIDLFGTKSMTPVLFAPIGVLSLAHPKGDLELAEASAASGVPMIFSNQASHSMEACASRLSGNNYWFQLYFSKSNELVESFVSRAENCGCKAIVLTLDTTTLGWRQRDLNHAYLPFIKGLGIAQYTSDPVFKRLMQNADLTPNAKTPFNLSKLLLAHQLMRNYPEPYFTNWKTKNPIKAVKTFIDLYSRPNLNWEDIKWLRSITKLPILLKGILHPADALRTIDAGIDGIIVSNHGGRQIDQVISSLDALKEIKKRVPANYPLLLDSGVRTGTDIFTALALGAKGILLGRPYVYALALHGKEGVLEYCRNLLAEFEITMSLAGSKSLQELNTDFLTTK
ncbi:MAG: alpha-hydroxy-acid oxidizing protein [Saprospiraceae bacterium]|nr:alpha-hydroxy-acid oxidizing protein [Candidatus Vicinibacter affinis]